MLDLPSIEPGGSAVVLEVEVSVAEMTASVGAVEDAFELMGRVWHVQYRTLWRVLPRCYTRVVLSEALVLALLGGLGHDGDPRATSPSS